MVIRRGDIYYADLRPVVGSEQGGIRPVLIVQNDVGNRHSPTVIVAAITSKMHKAKLPTHIELSKRYGIEKDARSGRLKNQDSGKKFVILTRRFCQAWIRRYLSVLRWIHNP